MLDAEDVIRRLGLAPHPEGGYFRESFRDKAAAGERAASTAIYYLLPQGEISRWHRVDAAEIWHFYAGAPLELSLSEDGSEATRQRLGQDLAAGESPQLVAPPFWWQSAKSLGAWTLVGCTVAPGFEFPRFELAGPELNPRYRD
jgi:predicted cupin superfamily sugar epimerase